MKRILAVTALAVTVLAGCGSSSPTATPAAQKGAGFPATVTAANGKVAVPTRPTRIVSLSPTATEMLYSIGAGHQVVGVDSYSTYPANAPRTKFTGAETSAESFVPLHPDLVLVAFNSGGTLVSSLQTVHIPVLLLPPAKTLADAYAQFRELGQATGHVAAADAEVARIRTQLSAIQRSVGNRAKGMTYYQEVDNTLYTVTSHTFAGQLYSLLGMRNVADAADSTGSGYPQLSAEYLVKANPDYVFLADTTCCSQTPATFDARPGYATITAVRDHHVVALGDDVASHWGPRVVDFLRIVADAVEKGGSTTPTTGG